MTRFLTLSLAIAASALLGACASTQPSPVFNPTDLAPVKHAIQNAETHVKSAQSAAQRLAGECKTKSDNWQAAYDSLQKELTDAYNQTQIAQEQLVEKQLEAIAQAKSANAVVGQRDKAVAHDSATTTRYHRAKLYGAISAGLLVLSGLFFFKGLLFLIPPPYNIVAMIGGPTAASAAFYLLL